MSERMYDLEFEQLDDGTIRLEQKDYSGDSCIVDLHPCQLRYIAESAGLLPARAVQVLTPAPAAEGQAMHSMSVEVVGDSIWIEQTRLRDMGGTDAAIELHPVQAAWLVVRLQQIVRFGEAHALATLRRRMLTLHRKLDGLACHFAREDLFQRSPYASDLFSDIDLAAELADEFVTDLIGAANGNDDDDGQRNENPSTISVTDSGETRNPGRPATGEAMTNTERQAKHRAKLKDSSPQQGNLGGM